MNHACVYIYIGYSTHDDKSKPYFEIHFVVSKKKVNMTFLKIRISSQQKYHGMTHSDQDQCGHASSAICVSTGENILFLPTFLLT